MYKQLTSVQRCAINLERQAKRTQKQIAEEIGVSQSTVSLELRRGSRGLGCYNWIIAQNKAEARKSRAPGNRSIDPLLLWEALDLLQSRQWSSEQISGYMAIRLFQKSCFLLQQLFPFLRHDR